MRNSHFLIFLFFVSANSLQAFAQKSVGDTSILFSGKLSVIKKGSLFGLEEGDGQKHTLIIPIQYSNFFVHKFTATLGVDVVEFRSSERDTKYLTSEKKNVSGTEFIKMIQADNFIKSSAASTATNNTLQDNKQTTDSVNRNFDENATYMKVQTDPWFRFENKDAATYIKEQISKVKKTSSVKSSGIITISFIVEKDGSRSNPKITNSSSEELSKLSLKILQEMPKWQPALQGGRAVRDQHQLSFEW